MKNKTKQNNAIIEDDGYVMPYGIVSGWRDHFEPVDKNGKQILLEIEHRFGYSAKRAVERYLSEKGSLSFEECATKYGLCKGLKIKVYDALIEYDIVMEK